MALGTSGIINTSGIQINKDACVVIVRTEWNAHVIDKLQEGCIRILEEKRVRYKIVEVPGAIEIPYAIKSYWDHYEFTSDKPAAFIALGCVIKGDTPHFDYVSSFVTNGIQQLNIQIPVPTVFGVLTVNTQEQADERTGGAHGHKGEEAAATALKMIALTQAFKNNSHKK